MGQPFQGGGPTRMEALKESFEQVIGSVSGVNVGIMRFDGPGGSIAYPVKNVDAETSVPTIENPSMLAGSDDAVQNLVSGEVSVNDASITLAYDPGGLVNSEVAVAIQHEDDDV